MPLCMIFFTREGPLTVFLVKALESIFHFPHFARTLIARTDLLVFKNGSAPRCLTGRSHKRYAAPTESLSKTYFGRVLCFFLSSPVLGLPLSSGFMTSQSESTNRLPDRLCKEPEVGGLVSRAFSLKTWPQSVHRCKTNLRMMGQQRLTLHGSSSVLHRTGKKAVVNNTSCPFRSYKRRNTNVQRSRTR